MKTTKIQRHIRLLKNKKSIENADIYYNAKLLKKAKKKKSFLERYVLDDIERLTKHEILGLVVVILTSVLLYGVVSTYTDIGLPQLFTYKSTFKETLLIEGQVQSLALDYSFFPERMERWSKDFSIGLGKLNDVITAQKENASRLLELQLTVIKKLSRENPGDSVLKDIISESVNTLQKEKKEIPKNDELYKHFPSFK